MATNLLLDTNVVIDYLGRRKPFFTDAQKVIAAGYFADAKLWMPAQSGKDAYYVLCHFSESDTVQDALLELCQVVTPVALTGSDLVRGARLKWKDYEDCLVALAAQEARADFIITRDRKGFTRSMVPALSPVEWLRKHERETGISYDEVRL